MPKKTHKDNSLKSESTFGFIDKYKPNVLIVLLKSIYVFACPTQSGFFGGGVFVLTRYGTKLREVNGNGISVGSYDKILDIR